MSYPEFGLYPEQTHCDNCKAAFSKWWHVFCPWIKSKRRFSLGIYCVDCAAPEVLFRNLGGL